MAQRTADDAPWHASALSLLDTLWSLDTHMGVIRRRLAVTLGFTRRLSKSAHKPSDSSPSRTTFDARQPALVS